MLKVYTDGASSMVPVNAGGWAWWVDDQHMKIGNELNTTNNRMELMAVLDALKSLGVLAKHNGGLIIYSDSLYIVDCFADRWYVRWRRNNWTKQDIKTGVIGPVANRDLWEPLLEVYEQYLAYGIPVSFRHIRGHGKDPNASLVHTNGNEQADRLAVQAKKLLMM